MVPLGKMARPSNPVRPNAVRIVLTGYTDIDALVRAVNRSRIYRYLTKPWDDERLRGHIAEAFRQKEMIDDNARLG